MKRALIPVTFVLVLFSCAPQAVLLDHPPIVKLYFQKKINRLEKVSTGSDSDQRQLLKTKVEFAYGILMEENDRLIEDDYNRGVDGYKNANIIFKEAKEIGHHLLSEKYSNFDLWLMGQSEIKFKKEDIFELYWYGAAIGGAIKSSRGNPFELIHLSKVGRCFKTGLNLDPNWGSGSLYGAMMSFINSRTDLSESAFIDSMNFYYENGLDASDSLDAGYFVNYAESVDKRFQHKDEFVRKLNHVLNMKLDKKSSFYLSNLIAQKRAKWLLSKQEDYFF